MGFTPLDYSIVVAYLAGIAAFGIWQGGRQTTVRDYFLGREAIPWWVVCFSIVAAETSALTFISIPGLAYLTDLGFMQVTLILCEVLADVVCGRLRGLLPCDVAGHGLERQQQSEDRDNS